MLVINSPPTLPSSELIFFLLLFRTHPSPSLSLSLSLSPPSGEAEGEDERWTQQAPLRHGGQAPVWVQREAAAPPEGENGRPGRKGDPLRLEATHSQHLVFLLGLVYLTICVPGFPQINSCCQVCSLTSLPSRKWPVKTRGKFQNCLPNRSESHIQDSGGGKKRIAPCNPLSYFLKHYWVLWQIELTF